MDNSAVEVISEGNEADAAEACFSELSEDQFEAVEAIAMDMSAAYVKPTKETTPLAENKIVHDRFDVMQMATKAVDQVRRSEDLVLRSLHITAIRGRRPDARLVHHSDRGGQYAGKGFRATLGRASMRQSMSRAADCYDNAFMESCFGTIKTELGMIECESMPKADQELSSCFACCNRERKHSSIGYQTPHQFETNHAGRK
ncbi:transposase [Aporhodopirellula aestuarii]|uniref:Transposase n=1 Tax=Aporhodopirellula aestuarii TaxID=2950107 RepID=A0ABT0UDP6_9BACT|nr:transposase [Aporhodopirellula aestuarii]MCM2375178.1 transposase [Aporhodopirellula aestuarii]